MRLASHLRIALMIVGAVWTVQAAEVPPLKLVQSIPLPEVSGRFDHLAVDAKGQRLFVAALGNNTLEVINLAAGKRIKSVPGMSKPTGVLFHAAANEILVANSDDGTLKVLSGTDYSVVRTLSDLADADNLRFDPETKQAWIGYGEGTLGLIDLATAKVLGKIDLPAHPESFQLERQGNRIFVNVPDAKQIAVIDRTKRAVTERWRMDAFKANFPMALDEPGGHLFVGCRTPARLVVLDIRTGKQVSDLAISGDVDDLFLDASRKRLYLSCGEGFIDTVVPTAEGTCTRIARLVTAPGARTALFSSDLDRFYLAVPGRGTRQAEIRVYQPQ